MSSFSKQSKIPSHPISIKSLCLLSLTSVIEGFVIKTLGFPPKDLILDSKSPKALDN